jgi:DNA (cytosine-5)-methyltransferase 1
MFRVIQEARPAWIVGENVAGIRSLEVAAEAIDLESGPDDEADGDSEYSVVLDSICAELEGIGYEVQPIIIPACAVGAPHRRDRAWIIAHAEGNGTLGGPSEICGANGRQNGTLPTESDDADRDAPDAADDFGQPRRPQQDQRGMAVENQQGPGWDIPWIEVATRLCRVDDGLPAWIHARRVARLKALGNAIVPQVAYEILKVIAEIERGEVA